MHLVLQDLVFALRVLGKRPMYAALTILIFALAIGANTTVFSVFNEFFLRPLPYPDDDRLVVVYDTYPKMGLEFAGTSIPDYLDRRERAPSLESLAIVATALRAFTGEGTPEEIPVARASPSLFDVLGLPPLLGRGFTEDEATLGNDRVVVLSEGLWRTRLGGRADAIGRDIRLDGEVFRVVGVMPEAFGFPNRGIEAWVPFAFTPQQMSDQARGNEFSVSIGRLRPGATIAVLNDELDAIVRANVERLPQLEDFVEVSGFTGRAISLREQAVGDLDQTLTILQGIVLAVLLIACANVANLQLARMAARRKELSVRAALGAGQWRIATLVVVEALVLAAVGAALGLAFAYAGLELVRELGLDRASRGVSFGLDRASRGFEFALDARVLIFTAGVAVLAALGSALLPLFALLREDLARTLQDAGRRGADARVSQPFRGGLVVVQIALSVALLVGAGLLTKSFYRLQENGAGFETESVWTARITLPETRYGDPTQMAQLYERALEELGALPGVTEAAYASDLPFGGNNNQGSYRIDGYAPPQGVAPPHAQQRIVSERYFPTLGIPVIMGRNFGADEPENVAIVDELMARLYFPDGNVLGRRIRQNIDPDGQWYTIIGVVPAVKHTSLTEEPSKETLYWHYKQRPASVGMFALRTTLPPEQLAGVATDAVQRIDPELPLYNAMTMDARVLGSLGPQRTPMVLTLVFAGVAFALAVIGVYGVLTWAVTQRFGEIGVRMAFGAKAADIVRMILKQGGRMILLGLGIGVVGAFALGRVLSSQIHDVSAADPSVFAVAVIGLAVAALVASWLPARRAARIDPMRALREE